jgi:periplasmic divalent cation tolerance protein
MSITLAYITFPDVTTARSVMHELLERQWIACANMLPGAVSLYRWQGKVEETSECVVVVKTQAEHLEAVVNHIKEKHPYQIPCILALPVHEGNPQFLQWVIDETA